MFFVPISPAWEIVDGVCEMYVTYFDEVKAMPNNGQHYYLVGGISVPMRAIAELEGQVVALALEVFGSSQLTTETEFHASRIYFGKGPFRGKPASDRIAILDRLASIIAGDAVKRAYAAIDTRTYAGDAAEVAFAFFCERAQMLHGRDDRSILIGDLDDTEVKRMVSNFSAYRTTGTPWQYGVRITRLVDSVHFARSHHSRMIQLADTYVFLATHGWGSRTGWMAQSLADAIRGKDLHPNRYKIWPTRA